MNPPQATAITGGAPPARRRRWYQARFWAEVDAYPRHRKRAARAVRGRRSVRIEVAAPDAEVELVKRAVEPLGWQFVSTAQRREPNRAQEDRSVLLFSTVMRAAGIRAAAARLGAQAVRTI